MRKFLELAEFRSARFAPILPEECQVNPNTYGAELASWLCTRLYEDHGIATSYPNQEDWMWFLSYSNETQDEFNLVCMNVDGADDRWNLALQRFVGWFGFGVTRFGRARRLIDALRNTLESEPSISELRWLYQEADL